MRKAMICVSVMLAMLHLWPLVFGSRTVADVASPKASAAVVVDLPKAKTASAAPANSMIMKEKYGTANQPKSCYADYQARSSGCADSDASCRLKLADAFDLCEATGSWPAN